MTQEPLEEGAMLLRGFVTAEAPLLMDAVSRIVQEAAFRHLVVPGGHAMSVAMTNCGSLGWVTDRSVGLRRYQCGSASSPFRCERGR